MEQEITKDVQEKQYKFSVNIDSIDRYCHIYKKRRAAETTLLQSFICKCATLVYIFIYQFRIFLKS